MPVIECTVTGAVSRPKVIRSAPYQRIRIRMFPDWPDDTALDDTGHGQFPALGINLRIDEFFDAHDEPAIGAVTVCGPAITAKIPGNNLDPGAVLAVFNAGDGPAPAYPRTGIPVDIVAHLAYGWIVDRCILDLARNIARAARQEKQAEGQKESGLLTHDFMFSSMNNRHLPTGVRSPVDGGDRV